MEMILQQTEENAMEPYWEWFCSIPGIYRTQREVLLHCFHDPRRIWEASARN